MTSQQRPNQKTQNDQYSNQDPKPNPDNAGNDPIRDPKPHRNDVPIPSQPSNPSQNPERTPNEIPPNSPSEVPDGQTNEIPDQTQTEP